MAVTGAVPIEDINTAIADTLRTNIITYYSDKVTFVYNYDQIKEGVIDTPMIQVYWTGHTVDPESRSAQSSFRGVVRQTTLTYNADLYPKQRADISEDFAILLPLVTGVQRVLEAQRTTPYFGEADISAIERWSAAQVTFEYPNEISFLGARYTIVVRVF